MADRDKSTTDSMQPKPATNSMQSVRQSPAYSTFPDVATHGPRDKRCFHGKPEDWKRNNLKRTFGGKLK
ncbi:MAG: hypothetical protein K2Y16_03630 [Burkholderiales bacterium]|nr:hypothetical protein [Burkholderiales bacterium]